MPLITISETPSGLTEAVDTQERQLAHDGEATYELALSSAGQLSFVAA